MANLCLYCFLIVSIYLDIRVSCSSLYYGQPPQDTPGNIVCAENQLSVSFSRCSGEASVCEAVSSWNLTLNCSSCSSAKEVDWKFGAAQPLPYNTSIAQIPAKDVEPSGSGCYTCICGGNSYSFTVDIRAADCPHLLVRNETKNDDVYLYPRLVETELNSTSEGMLTVNCTSTGWPTLRIDWIVDISGNLTSIYDHPNYNVTENGQVLVILFPSLKEIETNVTYACRMENAIGTVYAVQEIRIKGFYDYFLKPHETQSHGPVPILDDQEGVAYCAVNPEDGVHINYTVCAYHGTQTGLDWVASPFIANGSSDCCQCGLCDEGVLGPGVTAILSPSQPNYNKFSVPACLIRSKTVVDGSFVCLAQRKTDVQSSAKQALALFHFQPELPPCQSQTIALIVVSVMVVGLVVLCVVFLSCCCRYKRKCTCESRGDYTVRGQNSGENGVFGTTEQDRGECGAVETAAPAPTLDRAQTETLSLPSVPLPATSAAASTPPLGPAQTETPFKPSVSLTAASAAADAPTPTPSPTQSETPTHSSAADVLRIYRDRFIEDMESQRIVFGLEDKDIIPDGVRKAINSENTGTQQNEILYAHLVRSSTRDSLMTVCDAIIAVQGYPRMRKLGEDMKSMLDAPPSTPTLGPAQTQTPSLPSVPKTAAAGMSSGSALTESRRHGEALFEQVRKKQSTLIDGLKLDGDLLAKLNGHGLLTKKEFGDINAQILGYNDLAAGRYFVNAVLFQWPLEVFESSVRLLIEALQSQGDRGNRSLARKLSNAFLECGLDAPHLEDASTTVNTISPCSNHPSC